MAGYVHKELVAPNDTKHLARIREVVADAAKQSAFDERDCSKIVLAVDEAVSNIMEHAYEGQEEPGDIRITIDADPTRFEVVITDSGHEFDPSTIEVPDMADHVQKGRKKGLGIFLMRQIMDEVKYTFVQGLRNELRMVKYAKRKEEENA